jgi:hypothetical protein
MSWKGDICMYRMSGACSTRGQGENRVQNFGREI